MDKLIRKNDKGQLLYNIEKNEFSIAFGMVTFNLTMEEYLNFEKELKSLSNDLTIYTRSQSIKIPLKTKGFELALTPEELISFKDLFGFKTSSKVSLKLKINYSMN